MNEAIGSITVEDSYKPYCSLCQAYLPDLRETIVLAEAALTAHLEDYHKVKPYPRMIAPVVRP